MARKVDLHHYHFFFLWVAKMSQICLAFHRTHPLALASTLIENCQDHRGRGVEITRRIMLEEEKEVNGDGMKKYGNRE
jgi:hypothetical protein